MPRSASARSFLGRILRANVGAFTLTFGLLGLENALFLVYPLLGGFAIDAMLKGDALAASSYALMVLAFYAVGALRRAVDTRVFSIVYARLAAEVAADQHGRGESASRVVARVDLAREFVGFFQDHLPMLATSVISIFGAVAMLAWLNPWLGLASSLALALVLVALPAFARHNEGLQARVNDQREREVDVLSHGRAVLRHFTLLSRLQVRLSDLEAGAYMALGLIAGGCS